MQAHQAPNVIRMDFTTVRVSFQTDRGEPKTERYTYKILKKDTKTINDGDLVVVPYTRFNGDTRISVAIVMEIHDEPELDLDSDIEYKWVVSPIDQTQYKHLRETDEKIQKAFKKAKQQSIVHQVREVLQDELGLDVTKLLETNL